MDGPDFHRRTEYSVYAHYSPALLRGTDNFVSRGFVDKLTKWPSDFKKVCQEVGIEAIERHFRNCGKMGTFDALKCGGLRDQRFSSFGGSSACIVPIVRLRGLYEGFHMINQVSFSSTKYQSNNHLALKSDPFRGVPKDSAEMRNPWLTACNRCFHESCKLLDFRDISMQTERNAVRISGDQGVIFLVLVAFKNEEDIYKNFLTDFDQNSALYSQEDTFGIALEDCERESHMEHIKFRVGAQLRGVEWKRHLSLLKTTILLERDVKEDGLITYRPCAAPGNREQSSTPSSSSSDDEGCNTKKCDSTEQTSPDSSPRTDEDCIGDWGEPVGLQKLGVERREHLTFLDTSQLFDESEVLQRKPKTVLGKPNALQGESDAVRSKSAASHGKSDDVQGKSDTQQGEFDALEGESNSLESESDADSSIEESEDDLYLGQTYFSGEEQIKHLMSTCRTQWADFLKDFGTSEHFLVDGDALVLHACLNDSLDWLCGGQHLHLVWIVEKVLSDLKEREAKFDIFFFLGNRACFSDLSPSLRLAREVVLLHLVRLSKIGHCKVHLVSGSWLQPNMCPDCATPDFEEVIRWEDLLNTVLPAFILTDDPNQSIFPTVGTKYFIQDCLAVRYTYVVLLTDMKCVGLRMYGHITTPMLDPMRSKRAIAILNSLRLRGNPAKESAHAGQFKLLLQDKTNDGDCDLCDQVVIRALRIILRVHSHERNLLHFAGVMCVAYTIRGLVPLKLRSFRVAKVDVEEIAGLKPLMDEWHTAMLISLTSLAAEAVSANVQGPFHDGVADLFDGRLFYTVLFMISSDLEGVTQDQKTFSTAGDFWARIAPDHSLQSSLAGYSFIRTNHAETILHKMHNAAQKTKSSSQTISLSGMSLSSNDDVNDVSFLRQVLGDVQYKMAHHESNILLNRLGNRHLLRDHHFHSVKLLSDEPDMFINETEQRLYKVQKRVRKSYYQKWKERQKKLSLNTKEALAAVKFKASLLAGSNVKGQVIPELSDDLRDATRQYEEERQLKQQRVAQKRLESGCDELQAASHDSEVVKKGKKEQQGSSKKNKIIEDNKRKQQEEKLSKNKVRLESLYKDNSSNPEKCVATLIKFAETEKDGVGTEARLKVIDVVTRKLDEKIETKRKLVFSQIQSLLRDRSGLSDAQIKQVCQAAQAFGLIDIADKLSSSSQASRAKSNRRTQAMSSIVYQLQYAPELLARVEGVDGDDRVSFKPDKWQQKLLNVIDSANSALVVAPTASGKTFISYYVMEKCLRRSNDGIVVFVAPTKALVNQVKAEVEMRFQKAYQTPGKHLAGVFTRDFRKNVMTCQILITVPQCLEILLFSPTNIEWTQRIQYVILDEVHHIGEEDGDVWERIILFCKAPIVALSATLGDASRFEGWMRSVENSKGRQLYYVQHDERWNDLKTWLYSPGTEQNAIVPLHPCSAVRSGSSKTTISQSLKLLPEDCVSLFTAMLPNLSPAQADSLDPDSYFRKHARVPETVLWDLSMRDIEKWSADIKAVFNEMDAHDQKSVLSSVSQQSLMALQRSDEELNNDGEYSYLTSHLYNLVSELKANDLLPAICFHMSRVNCNKFAQQIVRSFRLQEKEARRREGWSEKLQAYQKKYASIRAQADRKLGFSSVEEFEEYRDQVDQDLQEILNKIHAMRQIDRRFTAFNKGFEPLTMEELEEIFGKYIPEYYEWMMQGMLRGVAVHHAGLSKKMRQGVEMLFRSKRLAVVFATSTLAVGINMPSKTSVFVGDAVYINGMSYRQMAGRAGRRGFDLRGNIIFCGMRSAKIMRLINSSLPTLQGNQVLTSSNVLRLILLHSLSCQCGVKEANDVVQATARLIKLPLAKSPLASQQTAHLFRFAVEHMCREGLLFPSQGYQSAIAVSDLGTLITHLHYVEPSNFAFLSLFSSGALNTLCQSPYRREIELMTVLCHLFNPRPLSPHLRRIAPRSPSIVRLPDLPDHVTRALNAYNRKTLEALIDYQQCFVQTFAEELGADDVLPFSKLSHASKGHCHLVLPSQKYQIVSSYVALSGNNDKFSSIGGLCSTLRNGLRFQEEMVPAFEPSSVPLNAYCLDFWKHGQDVALIRCNGIDRDAIFPSLKDFLLILKALLAALERRYIDSGDKRFGNFAVIDTLRDISWNFSRKLDDIAA